METALIIVVVGIVVLLVSSYRVSVHLNYIRKVVDSMADSGIASRELIRLLAQAVVSAQESEQDAEDARDVAVANLAELTSKVTLDDETKDLVKRALGNAVHAPAEPGDPIDENGNGIPDDQETPTEPDPGDGTESPPPDTSPEVPGQQ